MNYEKRVSDFNKACGASYIAKIHFLKFRKTSKGIKVDFTLGKPHEISKLKSDIMVAGDPYYCGFLN